MIENHETSIGRNGADARSPQRTANCTLASLRRSARVVTQFYDAALRSSGLKSTQFSLLSIVYRAGPVAMSRLAEEMVMDRTTLTRNLKPLERRGLVRVEPGKDQRRRIVALTPEGRKALAEAHPLWLEAQDHMVDGLGHDAWAGLRETLGRAVAVARRN